jgi:hypothetical protein
MSEESLEFSSEIISDQARTISQLRSQVEQLTDRNKELEKIASSVDEDPTLKYLEEKLYTKGEHSYCETIDNTVCKIDQLTRERNEARAACAVMRAFIEGVPHSPKCHLNKSRPFSDSARVEFDAKPCDCGKDNAFSTTCGTDILSALKECVALQEQALAHLGDAGNGSKHDPSWIRPMKMTRPEMMNACQQAYHLIHAANAKAKEVLK